MKPFAHTLLRLSLLGTAGALVMGTSYPSPISSIELASTRTIVAAKVASKSLPKANAAKKTITPFKAAAAKPTEPNTSIEESAVQKLAKIQNVAALLAGSKKDTSSVANCAECTTAAAVAELRYNACSERDSYLEKELEKKSKENTILGNLVRTSVGTKSIIKPVCIETAMLAQSAQSGKVVDYKTCDGKKAQKATARPCISENYFSLVNNSFDLVSRCMKGFIGEGESKAAQLLNIRAAYGMILVESGFHINIASKTGAGGIGQFTPVAITAVNKDIESVRTYLAAKDNVQCTKLVDEFLQGDTPMKAINGNVCERISISNGNPVTNMIYTYAALRDAKDYFDETVFQDEKLSKKFALSADDLAKVKRALMIWSHNTGQAGLKTPLTKLLTTKYAKAKVTNADKFLSELKTYAYDYPNKGNSGSKARRQETSRYYAKIEDRMQKVEENAAGGSCLN
ncbi:MAG: hypothetical protein J7501_06715 [Bdellovibrio sp.]|nr:hypothetical protein [Bdellovibrio sp.]